MKKIIKKILKEYYDENKLYDKNYVINRLKNAPYNLRKHIKDLPSIPCFDSQGNEKLCTKVPEVVYDYLSGRY